MRACGNESTNLEILLQSGKVEADGLLIKVPVTADFKARVTEDWSVVAPRWHREVDNFVCREETAEESTANAERTGTGD